MIKEVKVLPHQKAFVESNHPSTGLVAGFGAGKSFAGTLKTIIKKLQYPDVKVAYYLPTYGHIRDIAFDKFPEICNVFGLHYQLNKTDKELKIKRFGSIVFRNMTDPEYIIGYEVGYSLIDECDILPMAKMSKVFKQILARNRTRLPDGSINQLDVVGTPEGYRWFHHRFVTNAHENYKLIRARTTDNPYLPDNYIDTLKEDYDSKLLKQYLNGEFINVNGGSVYHQFDRNIHVIENIDIDKKYPLVISFDFNINPYNSIFLIQVINGKVYVIDNAIKNNAALIDSLTYLKEKFNYLGDYLFGATIFGDATGRARSQGTAQTNYDLITEAGFINQRIKTANPRVTDRVNVVNSMLKNGKKEVKLFICKRNTELINDFERMSYNEKGVIDKTDQELSHASDSAGYYIESEFSIIKQRTIKVRYA